MNTHGITVRINEIYDPQSRGVDLGRLFEIGERQRNTSAAPPRHLSTAATAETSPVLPLLSSLVGPRPGIKNALVPYLPPQKSTRLALATRSLESPHEKSPKRRVLTVPKPNRFQINKSEGHVSRLLGQADLRDSGKHEITLPFFASPLIQALELKRLCGRPDDLLLRCEGARWHIVEDDEQIDLRDRTQTYRLGPIQVYS